MSPGAASPNALIYGRGSGTLHTWTHGQFNIAPANENNSDRLVIACGKNSNGPRFATFGAIRNPTSGMYEVDPSFDLTEWQAALAGEVPAPAATHKLDAAAVAQLLRAVGNTKGELVSSIMAEYGVAKTRAYEVINQAEAAGTIIRDARKLYRAPPQMPRRRARKLAEARLLAVRGLLPMPAPDATG